MSFSSINTKSRESNWYRTWPAQMGNLWGLTLMGFLQRQFFRIVRWRESDMNHDMSVIYDDLYIYTHIYNELCTSYVQVISIMYMI